MNYNATKKIDGKWKTFGRIRKNKWDNLQLSFKNTPEFKALVNSNEEWLNFSLFEEKDKEPQAQQDEPVSNPPVAEVLNDDGMEIPF